ncbi:MAG: hydrogenase [Patescibacteria group bacterium]
MSSVLRVLRKVASVGTPTEPAPEAVFVAKELPVGENLRKAIEQLYGGRALRIRHVDAGSNNGEEYEMTALNNAFYDIERFGLSFVASPRHADVLTVSGPVTRNMEHALRVCYEMTPAPKIVIAVGDGACTGGIWKDSYAVVGAVENVIPVDLKIPGDPPSPNEILSGILHALTHARVR